MPKQLPEQTFLQGVEAFNQQQFYECHDLLEAIWMESPEAEKNFYQGILQIAVACYHFGNGNWRGTVVLLGEGIRRLADFQPSYRGIDVSQLRQDSYHLLQQLQPMSPEQFAFFVQDSCSQNRSTPNSDFSMTSVASDNEAIAQPHPYALPRIVKLNA